MLRTVLKQQPDTLVKLATEARHGIGPDRAIVAMEVSGLVYGFRNQLADGDPADGATPGRRTELSGYGLLKFPMADQW